MGHDNPRRRVTTCPRSPCACGASSLREERRSQCTASSLLDFVQFESLGHDVPGRASGVLFVSDTLADPRDVSKLGGGVEAPGIENEQRRPVDTNEYRKGSIGVQSDSAGVPGRASKCPIDRGDVTKSSDAYELSNVVETALAKALVLAAEAKRWDVVMAIAEELGCRGRSHSTSVAPSARPRRSSKV